MTLEEAKKLLEKLQKLEEQQKEIEKLKKAEEKDYTSVYLSGVYAGQDMVKDKIREKIKDLQENNNGDDYNLTNVVNILKELLGE